MVSQRTRVDAGAGSTPAKSTLYCPVCAHESPVDGDWIVRASGDRLGYVCPDCGSTITERPADPDAPALGDPSGRAANALGRLAGASVAAWREAVVVASRIAEDAVRPQR